MLQYQAACLVCFVYRACTNVRIYATSGNQLNVRVNCTTRLIGMKTVGNLISFVSGPTIEVQAVIKGVANLPCSVRPPVKNDSATLVVWYRNEMDAIYRQVIVEIVDIPLSRDLFPLRRITNLCDSI